MTIQTFDPKTSVITMTPDAAAHIRRQLLATGRDALRLAVTESGCSGYMYELDYIDTASADRPRLRSGAGRARVRRRRCAAAGAAAPRSITCAKASTRR